LSSRNGSGAVVCDVLRYLKILDPLSHQNVQSPSLSLINIPVPSTANQPLHSRVSSTVLHAALISACHTFSGQNQCFWKLDGCQSTAVLSQLSGNTTTGRRHKLRHCILLGVFCAKLLIAKKALQPRSHTTRSPAPSLFPTLL
jgi:hypothetical protein